MRDVLRQACLVALTALPLGVLLFVVAEAVIALGWGPRIDLLALKTILLIPGYVMLALPAAAFARNANSVSSERTLVTSAGAALLATVFGLMLVPLASEWYRAALFAEANVQASATESAEALLNRGYFTVGIALACVVAGQAAARPRRVRSANLAAICVLSLVALSTLAVVALGKTPVGPPLSSALLPVLVAAGVLIVTKVDRLEHLTS